MFAQPEAKRRWTTGKTLSLAAHLLFIYLLIAPPQAMIVLPMETMRGDRGASLAPIYMPAISSDSGTRKKSPEHNKNTYAKNPRLVMAARKPKTLALALTDQLPKKPEEPHAGTDLGLFAYGLINGHDVRPALPAIFPDPQVSLPSGMQGDVVVEVTIDDQGNVIATRLLQGIGPSIDDKIIATLQTWHFHPATLDGQPIPSQHDVHFHFPS